MRDRLAEQERKIERLEMENDLLKSQRVRKEVGLALIRHIFEYQAIKKLHDLKSYSIKRMCDFLHVSRSAYYGWLK